jgi:hypothetical protein
VYLGSTLELRPTRQIAVELDARNLLDTLAARVPRDPLVDDGVWVRTAVVDFTGYPLPGRTLTLTVRLEPGVRTRSSR